MPRPPFSSRSRGPKPFGTASKPKFPKPADRPYGDRPSGDRPAADRTSNGDLPPRTPKKPFQKTTDSRKPYEAKNFDGPKSQKPTRKAPRTNDGLPPSIKPIEAAPIVPINIPAFEELGLKKEILRALVEMGFESPTPIQARAIPVLNEGHDLLGMAQTGTGKTAAFGLPLIQRLDPHERSVQALVMAPTRELAIQVAGGIHGYAKYTGLRVVPVYGGQPIDRQIRALHDGAQIVVGTPGRLLDHLRRGSLTLDRVKFCALDEADEMLTLGFYEDMETILAQLPDFRQLAFFSATMPPRIAEMTRKFLRNPQRIEIQSTQRTVDNTAQAYYEVPRGQKLEALVRVLDMETPGSTIVFCRTRKDTQELSDALNLRGYRAEPIHGDMGQTERERVLRKFREGNADLLIATDVAARGLDIDSVTHVINYDVPWDVEQYIHRIGRTGRAGRSGDAITLVEGKERRQLKNIERMIGTAIRPVRIPTAADIAARRRDVFRDNLKEALEAQQFDAFLNIVEQLSEDHDLTEIAAAAIQMLWQSQHSSSAEIAEEANVDGERPETGMVRLFIGMGRQDGLRPADLVGAIVNETELNARNIGAIDILDRAAFVEVPAEQQDTVVEALRNTKLRNKRPKIDVARPRD